MYCKDCKFGDFSESSVYDLSGYGYGVCHKLIAETNDNGQESQLASVESQPLAFNVDRTEIGWVSVPINVRHNFGCIVFEIDPLLLLTSM
jgi:hypothetical protein